MAGLKKLNLNREKIVESIICYAKSNDYSVDVSNEFESKGLTRNRLNLSMDGNNFYIDFHFNSDGTTTIEDFGGECLELKKKICAHIKNECEIGEGYQSNCFVVKNISEEDYKVFVELITESEFYKEKMDATKFKGIYDEVLTVTYYNTGTLMLQGKPLLLFNDIKSKAMELLDNDGMVETIKENYKIDIDISSIVKQRELLMPNSYNKNWNTKFEKTINTAFILMNLDVDLPDYTVFVFSAYRALEAHLRFVLDKNDIKLSDEEKCFLHIANKKTRTLPGGKKYDEYELKNNISQTIKDKYASDLDKADKIIKYIEKVYLKLSNNRNAYFHWNNPACKNDISDRTNMVESFSLAKEINEDVMELIDMYYTL